MASSLDSEFDFIVVGAGSAGCVVAARLAENGKHSVLLLEAGGRDLNPWIHIPIGYGKLFNDPRVNWMNESCSEPGLEGRRIFQPRGKVLGGTGSINGMLYVRGQPGDFDHWRELGNDGWGYQDVLPWFMKSERQVRGADGFHGDQGPLWVSDQPQTHPLADALLAAAAERGIPVNTDFNAASQEGAGYLQTNTRRGVRWSTAAGYLKPALKKPNLKLQSNALVERILFDGNRAVGIRFALGGQQQTARARREIVVCAGAFNTPHLMQVSGIGDASRLRERGIDVVHHLPGVGQNLHDHFRSSLVFVCSQPVTHNDSMRGNVRRARAALQYALQRKGPLATGLYAGAFLRTTSNADTPDIQVSMWTSSLKRRDAKGVELHDFSGFTMNAIVLQPGSRGHVAARTADINDPPSILFNYLQDKNDLATAIRGVKAVRALAAAPSLAAYVAREHTPGIDVQSDEQLEHYVRSTGGSTFHAVGSCRMGPDALAVVDAKLKVHGIDGLRVADASVMPRITSGNTQAATVMIGERAADFCLHG